MEGYYNYAFVDAVSKLYSGSDGNGQDKSPVKSFFSTMLQSSNEKYKSWRENIKLPEYVSNRDSLSVRSEQSDCHSPNFRHQLERDSQETVSEFPGDEHALIHHEKNSCFSNSASEPSFKLPSTSDDSILLSEDFRAFIHLSLPTIARDRHWILLYSTARHGTSMHTLYQRSSKLPEPYLLVVGDSKGVTFGGLVTATLKPRAQRKYIGTSDTFVFTNLHEEFQLYKATGVNRYYLLCTNDAISFGGGGHFAIHLDETLLTGSSGACDTFGNGCLASSSDFSVTNVEVWGFSHSLMQG
ncbi:hypothetical protein KP509_26G061300 [Ceratopteris richardii]|nr:hypothetical protein KP509_26G061300 [Ceratopteris richardii]